MTKKNDGGAAFPCSNGSPQDAWGFDREGASLRDYFAAKAMQGMLANPAIEPMLDFRIAKESYELADAMLAERDKG